MKVLLRYIFLVLLMAGKAGWCQSFFTKVSSKTIGRNDLLEVQYVAENIELSDFILPKYPGWLVQSGPNFSSNRVQTGNLVKQQIIYSLTLQPTRSGKLSVPSANITIDQHTTRQSNTVTIDVKDVSHVAGAMQNNSSTPLSILPDEPPVKQDNFIEEQLLRKGESAVGKIKNNLLIKLDVSKTSPYVGEPVIATYKLCTRLRSQSRVLKQPEFSGCTVTELTTEQAEAKNEMINGRMYNVYVIRKVQLTPLQAGDLTLPQATVENNVSFYKEENLTYRDLYYNPAPSAVDQQITLSNATGLLHVKPLPPSPPEGFDGAVGKFTIDVSTGNNAITTNSNSQMIVVVEGAGNLQQVQAPGITWPAGIDGFDPVEQEEVDRSVTPAVVRKTFSYPFVVNKTGPYTLPAIRFSYFNPSMGRYEMLETSPITFNAAQGKKQLLPVANFVNTADFQNRLYIIVIAAFVAVIAGLYWYNRRYTTKAIVQPPASLTKMDEPWPVADTTQFIHYINHLNPLEDEAFYKQLHRHILSFLQTRFFIEESQLVGFANSHAAESNALHQLNTLLSECRLGMYTPIFNTEEALNHRRVAIELLTKLEKM